MMASRAMAVLPVLRSPMISSRWPRPSGIIASMAVMPVSSGRETKSRSMIGGAGRSTGSLRSAAIWAPPSSGRPTESTTRPSSASPTGTRATCPVPETRMPAPMDSSEPNRTQPMLSASRLVAMPSTSPGKMRSSSRRVSGSPDTRATPSPTCSTRPIDSTRGASGIWRARCRASGSQRSSSSSRERIAVQLLARAVERVAPAQAKHRGREVQLGARDQLLVAPELQVRLGPQPLGEPLPPARLLPGRRAPGR